VGGIFANFATGYVVQSFSYKPIFAMAGVLHPIAAVLLVVLLGKSFRRQPVAQI
jgi:hypothetical protein